MKSKYKFYKIGGCVRDEYLNLKPKDIDLVCLGPSFDEVETEIIRLGGKIFLLKPEYLTIRCKLHDFGSCDVRLARIDGNYSDGRRPDSVRLASSLEEDLSTRDFSMNAMAKDLETGEIIDPFNGREDLNNKIIKFVGNPSNRLSEDKLRAFRAIRFCVTKEMSLDQQARDAISSLNISDFTNVSAERIREELFKMFSYDTDSAFSYLCGECPVLLDVALSKGIWFKPTLEAR